MHKSKHIHDNQPSFNSFSSKAWRVLHFENLFSCPSDIILLAKLLNVFNIVIAVKLYKMIFFKCANKCKMFFENVTGVTFQKSVFMYIWYNTGCKAIECIQYGYSLNINMIYFFLLSEYIFFKCFFENVTGVTAKKSVSM